MANEIKIDEESKNKFKDNLSKLENTMDINITRLIDLIDDLGDLSGNPEMENIVTKLDEIKLNKHTVKKNVTELKAKTDLNLQEILELDNSISESFKGW